MKELEVVEISIVDQKSIKYKNLIYELKYKQYDRVRVRKKFYEKLCGKCRLAGFDISNISNLKNFLLSDCYGEKVFGNNNLGIVVNVYKRLETFNLSLFDIEE